MDALLVVGNQSDEVTMGGNSAGKSHQVKLENVFVEHPLGTVNSWLMAPKYAVASGVVAFVSWRTRDVDAFEVSALVEAALILATNDSLLCALVNVYARSLIGRHLVSWRTGAMETSRCVLTAVLTARTPQTFVNIDALTVIAGRISTWTRRLR